MKKLICIIMVICLMMSVAACAPQKEMDDQSHTIPGETESEDVNKAETEPTNEDAAEPTAEPTAVPTEATTEPSATKPTNEPGKEENTSATGTTPTPTKHQHSYTTTVVEPTCEEEGFTIDHCSCGESNVYNTVPALGHTFGEWVTTIEPTTTSNGQMVRICSVCNYQEYASVEKLPACETHNWVVTEKETVDSYPLRHYGYVTTACSVCGQKKGTEARYFMPDNIDYAAEVSTIISLVNSMRAGEGLSQLTTSGDWDSWAATRAQEISIFYSHNRPSGASWGRNDGVNMAFGENIAKNLNSGADFYYGFLNSPQHCGLMKTPDATGIAVSIYVNEHGDSYCAMVIYGPMGIVEEIS